MLQFRFNPEKAGNKVILRPRITTQVKTDTIELEIFALLDSGADRTIIPMHLAEILKLPIGQPTYSSGIGGLVSGYESTINLTFLDINGKRAKINDIPVFVLPNLQEFVIGRTHIFDLFRIIFEQFNRTILLDSAI